MLGGGRDFFSNGIHLNVIEAAADPAEESWANINAMNDLVEAVLTTTDRLVVAAVGGNAAAGGAMLALAADEVWCRRGSVLNPHYRLMGLSGSEYWTHTLPSRVGPETAERLAARGAAARAPKPPSGSAWWTGPSPAGPRTSRARPSDWPSGWPRRPPHRHGSPRKKTALERQEALKPLAAYRQEELAAMRSIFFDPDAPYHACAVPSYARNPRPGRRLTSASAYPEGARHIRPPPGTAPSPQRRRSPMYPDRLTVSWTVKAEKRAFSAELPKETSPWMQQQRTRSATGQTVRPPTRSPRSTSSGSTRG